MMDNFHMDVVGEGDTSLAKAIEIAYANEFGFGTIATHYKTVRLKYVTSYYLNPATEKLASNVQRLSGEGGQELRCHHITDLEEAKDGHLTLVLCWAELRDEIRLPFSLDAEDAISFVRSWLKHEGDPGNTPDIDGDCDPGWRIFTGYAGYNILCAQACWALKGK